MKKTSFRWYLKKRLTESTDTGTLNLRKLAKAAEQDEHLGAVLMLYVTANMSREDAQRRLGTSHLLTDYGRYYDESGCPGREAIRAMPDAYHEVYDDYLRYTSEKRTHIRVKAKCRQELLRQMERQGLSRRAVGKLCEVDFACISRFLQGGDYAMSADRLKQVLDTLRGMENGTMQNVRIYIDDYRETELAKGLVEISFTLNIAEDALAALRQLCRDNNISFPTLIENFLNWLIEESDYSDEWVRRQNQ